MYTSENMCEKNVLPVFDRNEMDENKMNALVDRVNGDEQRDMNTFVFSHKDVG